MGSAVASAAGSVAVGGGMVAVGGTGVLVGTVGVGLEVEIDWLGVGVELSMGWQPAISKEKIIRSGKSTTGRKAGPQVLFFKCKGRCVFKIS